MTRRLDSLLKRGDQISRTLYFMVLFFTMTIMAMAEATIQDLDLKNMTATQGFAMIGAGSYDYSGIAASEAGDVNGDGIADVIVGAQGGDLPGKADAGISYVIFGHSASSPFAPVIDFLSFTTGYDTGFRIYGTAAGDSSGLSVDTAGDLNGDGLDDIVIGSPSADPLGRVNAGVSYVIFGRKVTSPSNAFTNVELSSISSSSAIGFRIIGAAAADNCGSYVSHAGDVNGDGVDDVIVASTNATPPPVAGITRESAGIVHVIYGHKVTSSANAFNDIDLELVDTGTSVGFRILGATTSAATGYGLRAAGDVNGDGIQDIIIGAYAASISSSRPGAGVSYVIYGRRVLSGGGNPFSDIDLLTVFPSSLVGFRIFGAVSGDNSGISVSGAGDVNHDGISDVIIGSYGADPLGTRIDAGISYVVFGRNGSKTQTAFSDIDLSLFVTGQYTGFRVLGAAGADNSGRSVGAAGDVNADGIDDFIIGAKGATPDGTRSKAGITYVLFGRKVVNSATAFADIDLLQMVTGPTTGFRVLGAAANDAFGLQVGSAGDVNGDGAGDIVMGAFVGDASSTRIDTGITYVIYGIPNQPTSQPSSHPTGQPSRQPSSQPVGRPSAQPSSQPSRCPSAQPTYQPTVQPSRAPSLQPSSHPSGQPSRQPSSQPIGLPSTQPSSQPSRCPSAQPSRQPMSRPTGQPTTQPSRVPSLQPTQQPSGRPTSQPSRMPTCQPLARPSAQPSAQPVRAPTSQPSAQPSSQPSLAPTSRPSCQPSANPTSQPTMQPSSRPTVQPNSAPSSQPSSEPSTQPTSAPSTQPSGQPSARPSVQPSGQPSHQPSTSPTTEPSTQATAVPSIQPSAQPSSLPSAQPSARPTTQSTTQPNSAPSTQPTAAPSAQPSSIPTIIPSTVPTSSPTDQPSAQPSEQPSSQPSCAPSVQPTVQPSCRPTQQPSTQPTCTPSAQPTYKPSARPSSQPTEHPTRRDSALPSTQPSSQPSCIPSAQPSCQPSLQPSRQPTRQPTSLPSLMPLLSVEWVKVEANVSSYQSVALVKDNLWLCGTCAVTGAVSCYMSAMISGAVVARYSFPWDEITTVVSVRDKTAVGGRSSTAGIVSSYMAICTSDSAQLECEITSFYSMDFLSATYNAYAMYLVYTGLYVNRASVTVIDTSTATSRSYTYTTPTMRSITPLHVQTPKGFVGSFIAGIAASAAPSALVHILCGWVRTDTGQLSAMSIAPTSSNMQNSALLVTALALENLGPDSFMVGGLALSDGAGTSAYLVRANALFYSVVYGVRYLPLYMLGRRQLSTADSELASVARGLVLVGDVLYIILDSYARDRNTTALSVLKTRAATGDVIAQTHVSVPGASLRCTDVAAGDILLTIACTAEYVGVQRHAIVLTTLYDLSFTVLPAGYIRHTNATFRAEPVAFKRSILPISSLSSTVTTAKYVYTTSDQVPSLKPSVVPTAVPSRQPTDLPSTQPSSSPTSAPTLSPQPTSQPSSARPTNTHRPSLEPTAAPTVLPSALPTAAPSRHPTPRPTESPSPLPTVRPSTTPSRFPTAAPTRRPSAESTQKPTAAVASKVPSPAPTSAVTTADPVGNVRRNSSGGVPPYTVGVSIGGAVLIALCCLAWYKIQQHKKAEKERALRKVDFFARQALAVAAMREEHLKIVAEEDQRLAEIAQRKVRRSGRGGHAMPVRTAPVAPPPPLPVHVPGIVYVSGTDSSVDISSLHSSEMSSVSYSLYSDGVHNPSESWESAMEDGFAPQAAESTGSSAEVSGDFEDEKSIYSDYDYDGYNASHDDMSYDCDTSSY